MTKNSGSAQSIGKPRRKWLQAFFLMSSVFLSGVIVGGVAATQLLWNKHLKAMSQPRFDVERMIHNMQTDFDLTEAQSEQLEKIFSNHHKNMRAIHEDLKPKVDKEIDSLRSQVEAVLTPDQVDRWNATTCGVCV
ncbi:MAG: periplasmic heavy metal sensor [Candidatus Lindowbacteria bacterium]|nr:periplasmic heavy metal sensor [Candidatus Lindowbacteria bacterium]